MSKAKENDFPIRNINVEDMLNLFSQLEVTNSRLSKTANYDSRNWMVLLAWVHPQWWWIRGRVSVIYKGKMWQKLTAHVNNNVLFISVFIESYIPKRE